MCLPIALEIGALQKKNLLMKTNSSKLVSSNLTGRLVRTKVQVDLPAFDMQLEISH